MAPELRQRNKGKEKNEDSELSLCSELTAVRPITEEG
jgi:hypothetical protein